MDGQQTISTQRPNSSSAPSYTFQPTTDSASSIAKLAELSGFDENQLKESLVAISSDPKESLELLLDTYLPDAESLLQQIRKSIAELDFKQLKFAAHTLKSSSALMGIMALSELCRQIEQQARNQDATSLATLLLEAETAYTHSRQLLLSYPAH